MKYACIARHRGEFPVRLMCRVLAVSPAGFYASQTRPPSARTRADQRLRLEIRTAHAASQRRYGAPKIHEELRTSGIAVSRKRVARLMRLDGLRSKRPRAFRVTTQSGHAFPVATNALGRQFDVSAHNECDRVWAADITYLATGQGLALPGGDSRPGLAPRGRLVCGRATGSDADAPGAADGAAAAAASNRSPASLGSRRAVRERRVSAAAGGPSHHVQHESAGAIAGTMRWSRVSLPP